MPAVRFSRDKRGYEYVYLVHTPLRRGKPGRSRVLYWYRTPPGVRIGRRPFDEEVQRTLERQNPGLTFDWEAIIATPMPPPDMTEFWRERRRVERAARQERRAAEPQEDQVGARGTEPEAELVSSPQEGTPGAVTAEPGEALAPGARKRRRRRSRRVNPAPVASERPGDGTSEAGPSASEPEPDGTPDS